MIRRGIAFLALIACAGPARAELTVRELEQQPFRSEVANFFRLGQGDFLLSMHSHPWSVVYVLAPDGTVRERAQTPWGTDQFVVPYRNGFAVQRLADESCRPNCGSGASTPVEIVAYERATDPQPKVLYEPAAPFVPAQLYAAPDGQDLYVLEAGHRITRIDANGQIAWQQTIARLDSAVVATDDGVAFVYKPYDRTLRAIDRNGRLRWETSVPQIPSQEPIYSPAGFITLPLLAGSPQEFDESRLLNFDARTGQLVSDVRVPPFHHATGTQHGLLVAGWMLGQRYVGMLDRDGKFAWLRRYVADPKVSDIHRAAMTRDSKLVFVTRDRTPSSTIPPTTLVITDSTAVSLAETRGGCLETRWQRPVELEVQLRRRGLRVLPPKAAELTSKGKGCSNREKQFVTFLHALAAAVPASAVQSPGSRQTILVRLTSSGAPIRLESYSADRSGHPTAGVYLSFVTPYDRAAEFWKIVATQVQPHLDRMKVLHERFMQMTGFLYVVGDQGDLDYARTLATLERGARTVDEKIANMPPAQIADIRRTPPNGWVDIVIRLEGFGSDNALYPFDVADRTLLDIVAEHRRRVAEGEIIIRD